MTICPVLLKRFVKKEIGNERAIRPAVKKVVVIYGMGNFDVLSFMWGYNEPFPTLDASLCLIYLYRKQVI
jgi:hypothetical protein